MPVDGREPRIGNTDREGNPSTGMDARYLSKWHTEVRRKCPRQLARRQDQQLDVEDRIDVDHPDPSHDTNNLTGRRDRVSLRDWRRHAALIEDRAPMMGRTR